MMYRNSFCRDINHLPKALAMATFVSTATSGTMIIPEPK